MHDKLVPRHPHVFGDVEADGADDVVANWEQIKKAEKGRESVFDGIPDALPALLYALKVQKKAARWPTAARRGLGVGAAARRAVAAADRAPTTTPIGELLFAVVDQARLGGRRPRDRAARRRRPLPRPRPRRRAPAPS